MLLYEHTWTGSQPNEKVLEPIKRKYYVATFLHKNIIEKTHIFEDTHREQFSKRVL